MRMFRARRRKRRRGFLQVDENLASAWLGGVYHLDLDG